MKANSKKFIVENFRPETKWANNEQVENIFEMILEDWTYTCGNMLRWFVIRGERLIKLGDSWFSAKSI